VSLIPLGYVALVAASLGSSGLGNRMDQSSTVVREEIRV